MKRKIPAVLLGVWAMGAALPADGPVEKGPKQSFEVSTTERVNFLPGGAIHLENSYGYLTVEGWDEPEVEMIVTKSTNHFLEAEQKEKADKLFNEQQQRWQRRPQAQPESKAPAAETAPAPAPAAQ